MRVPAVVVSPLIPQGMVDHTLYDHASVPATLESLYGFSAMTDRDANANNVLGLLSLTTPRTDCPTVLSNPPQAAPRAAAAASADTADAALPESGNAIGFLQILVKTDIALTRGDPAETAAIKARVEAITTVSQAEAYANEVIAKATAARAARAPVPPPPRPRATK